MVADGCRKGIRSERRGGERTRPLVCSVSVLGLVARGEYKADVAVLVECGAESFLPHIGFLASVFNVAADLDIADIEELKFLGGESSVHNGTAELSVATVDIVINGVRLKSGCRHFVDALTGIAVGRGLAYELFKRGHVGTLADSNNAVFCRIIRVPAEIELRCVCTRGERDERVVVSYSFPVAVPFGLSEHIASVCRGADSKARGEHEQCEQNGQRPFCCFHWNSPFYIFLSGSIIAHFALFW